MSCILYYSNFCENCKKLLIILSKSGIKNNIHYICTDKRIQKNNATYVILENNQGCLGETAQKTAILRKKCTSTSNSGGRRQQQKRSIRKSRKSRKSRQQYKRKSKTRKQ